MLNGIGGRTIVEAQQRLSYREFLSWARFRNKRGSLHPGMRIERGTALLASLHANTHGRGGYSLYDFMPHEQAPALTLEQAMATWA
ncbi:MULTISPECIES: phage tail assembly protein T [unclassified Pseudomonas]|uniref:phage tail assembly protein T n=1 Tax=unclassified Pseudomonas TaxID=196821 RepID=UPI001BCF9B72|nr:hypothetical protein [Pseudomonas sp. Pc102]BBP82884.1 hypothetical protein PHLH8_25260 [Pseudomonas sp. Pc102]